MRQTNAIPIEGYEEEEIHLHGAAAAYSHPLSRSQAALGRKRRSISGDFG
jgi:hypothetical protein